MRRSKPEVSSRTAPSAQGSNRIPPPGSRPPLAWPRAALAGAVGAAVGVGATEAPHSVLPEFPSLVLAVGTQIIDRAPQGVVHFAIERFGTNDKPALLTGIVTASLVSGAVLGVASRQRRHLAPWVFAVAAAVGVAATVATPGDSFALAVAAGAAGAAAGTATLRLLLDLAAAPATATADPSTRSAERIATAVAGRRAFLLSAISLGALAALPLALGRSVGRGLRAAAARAQVVLPRPQRPAPAPAAGASFPELGPVITSNNAFYRIDTALAVPDVDPSRWQLSIEGMVDRTFSITYDELLAMPMVEHYVTLSCVSNEVGGSLIGTAKWLGVPLSSLLDRAGVQPGATQIVGRSVDGFTAGFPTAAASDGRTALVAIGMNGEPLPVLHGFPARLVVAGLYGYVSATKWLSRVEFTTLEGFDGYWVPRGWAKQAPIKTQARIDVPRGGQRLSAGTVTVAGVAWAPTRGISKVEVRVDDGAWSTAELSSPLSTETWVQWRYGWPASAGRHVLSVRATDGQGVLQDPAVRPPQPDGATGYHSIVADVAAA